MENTLPQTASLGEPADHLSRASKDDWQPARIRPIERWCERARNHPKANRKLAKELAGQFCMVRPYRPVNACCDCPTFEMKDDDHWLTKCQIDTD